ncbi:sulfatase [Robiginitalea sp. M366]|uniref:sulfatase family protein n=1 Tax=Robiginitalea aestuariiviva TaxID=3036903 RepID=UPI00240D9432|nr:sulfatase [Robiginitalea aestuariiviva]MDG1571160.1 sulfatase [Robiginitalea aestuariiviva]
MPVQPAFSVPSIPFILFLAALLAGPVGYAQEAPATRPPNVIVVFADDLGYGDLGVFGHPTIRTPNLDRMALEGQKWTQFYAAASVCTPSRAGLMTGRLPIRSGMASSVNRVLFPDSHGGLPASEVTLAEQLKAAGYATGMVGKWHLGHQPEYLPVNHGFDDYFGIPYSNDMDLTRKLTAASGYWELWTREYKNLTPADFNVPLIRDTEVVERPADQRTLTRRYTEEAIRWVRDHKEGPFFMYLAHNLPHVPLFASEDFLGSSRRGLYGDVVEEIDHGMGLLLEMLREEGLDQNTIVVFTSDNGPWLPTEISGGTAGMLREGKGTTWEGGMREPTIFWGPAYVRPGVVMEMGSTMDLLPTFSAMAGVPLPQDRILDGVDLTPVLAGNGKSARNTMFYYRGSELYAVRLGPFKAHFITEAGYRRDTREEHGIPLLFNVEEDPSERFNIAEAHPEVLEAIRKLTAEHRAKMVRKPDQLKDRG